MLLILRVRSEYLSSNEERHLYNGCSRHFLVTHRAVSGSDRWRQQRINNCCSSSSTLLSTNGKSSRNVIRLNAVDRTSRLQVYVSYNSMHDSLWYAYLMYWCIRYASDYSLRYQHYPIHYGGTAAAAPPPFRPSNLALCGSCPLVTPY